MSLSCPRCGNSIEQDFGMITCGQCQTILFIDMEGQIQIAGDESADASAPVASSSGAISSIGASAVSSSGESAASDMPVQADFEPDLPDQEMQEPAPVDSDSNLYVNAGNVLAANEAYANAHHEPAAFANENSESPAGSDISAYADGSAMKAPAVAAMVTAGFSTGEMGSASEEAQQFGASNVFSEVSDFGNNKQDFGALSYTLYIENIDTGEIRQKLAEALTDSKFQWDVNKLLQKIEKGRLEIAQINPVKASILVHRLQEVPVRVSWDQKLL